MLYAQDAPYWGTTVSTEKSQAGILQILGKLGASQVGVHLQQVKTQENVMVIMFEWPKNSKVYRRFEFPRLEIRKPKYGRYREKPTPVQTEQAQRQAARIGFYMLKNLVTFMHMYPFLLTGFAEIPKAGIREDGLALTVGELEQDQLLKALPPSESEEGP